MAGFKAAFINELDKMAHRKKIIVVIFLSLLVIVGGQLLTILIRSGFGIRGLSSSDFPIVVLGVLVNIILPLFIALAAADTFTTEYSHNTMKLSIVRPVTRLKLYTAKVSAILVFVAVTLGIAMILSVLTGLLFNAPSGGGAGIAKVFTAYLAALYPMLTLSLGMVVLANLLHSGTSVLFLSILLFIVMKAAGFALPQYSSLFITSMLDWHRLWLADTLPAAKLLRLFLIMTGYSTMFFTAGYYMFEKKDF